MSRFSGKCDLYDCIYTLFSYKAENDSEDAMIAREESEIMEENRNGE